VAVGGGTTVSGVGQALKLGELDVCRQVKELVEQKLVKVSTTPMPTLRAIEMPTNGTEKETESAATWDPFAIEIPGVNGLGHDAKETNGNAADVVDETPPEDLVHDEISVVADEDPVIEADEMAKQLASLSPKAARAVAAAAQAATDEEREAALAEASDDDEEPINRGLLLKFLSSVKS